LLRKRTLATTGSRPGALSRGAAHGRPERSLGLVEGVGHAAVGAVRRSDHRVAEG